MCKILYLGLTLFMYSSKSSYYMMNSNHKSKPNTKNQTKNPIIPIPKAMIVIVIITPPISQEFSIWFWFDIAVNEFFQIYMKNTLVIIPQLKFVLFLLMMHRKCQFSWTLSIKNTKNTIMAITAAMTVVTTTMLLILSVRFDIFIWILQNL